MILKLWAILYAFSSKLLDKIIKDISVLSSEFLLANKANLSIPIAIPIQGSFLPPNCSDKSSYLPPPR